MTTQSAIENIIENFNWERVHNTMLTLDWRWATYNSGTEVPSIGALVITAHRLLNDACLLALKNKSDVKTATGGFHAKALYCKETNQIDNLELYFQITSWDVDLNENDESYF